jgi:homeobox protein TGIF1
MFIEDTQSKYYEELSQSVDSISNSIKKRKNSIGFLELDQKSKHKRTNYPKTISKILRDWLEQNVQNPYPTEDQKANLALATGLDQTQINNWFINARRRILPTLLEGNNKNEI